MGYFNYLSKEQKRRMFLIPPEEGPIVDKETLAHAIGATLYMPGNTNREICRLIAEFKIPGLISTVLCLEDSIDDRDVAGAEKNLALQLGTLLALKDRGLSLPYIFVRVRNVRQFKRFTRILGPSLHVLTGFVFPKFDLFNGPKYFEHLAQTNRLFGVTLYGMPIIESPGLINLETRAEQLLSVKNLLDSYRELVLNIRIGATDLSGIYGLRRYPEHTIYDISVIREFIAALVNIFGRPQDKYVISGPVWEYFSTGERVFKPMLRQTPFNEQFGSEGKKVRQRLLCRYLDGLIREVMLDKANGLIGKTVIHPSHLLPVQALYAVTHEEYCDARDILAHGRRGGVAKSVYNNKMNEFKPHTGWAKKIITFSQIYGVLNEKLDYTSIIYAGEKFQGFGQSFSGRKGR